MPPKATTANNASANASTLNANGQPKRKRTRGRGGRGRGGRGKKNVSSDSSSDSSSSSDDDSSDDEDEPVASTSKIATASSAAKSVSSTAAAPSNGKGKAASSSASSSDEDSDDEGNASDSSSSSSFLTTSDEEEDMPTPRNVRGQNTQGSALDGASAYGQSQRGFEGQDEAARAKRPEMTKPSDPPYIQFGADADLAHNARAFGKPILWGLLPGDTPAASTSASVFDDETDERSKAIIEAEKAKAEERYLKFRDDYVSKMISRFGGSLDAIRQKEADTMKESRLQVLIQSIAGGADTFTSRDGQGIWKTKEQRGEREVVLEGLDMQEEHGREIQSVDQAMSDSQ